MKYIIIFITLYSFSTAFAQKIAYVNSEYVLTKMPDYNSAQQSVDNISKQWLDEIEAKYAEIDNLRKMLEAEQILLTDEMKRRRQAEIDKKTLEARELQKQRFGVDGEIFTKRQELIKPVQDKVYNAIKEIAKKKNYASVIDLAGSVSVLYLNPKFDISDDVLEELGIKSGSDDNKKRK
jgi:outer membrane protein